MPSIKHIEWQQFFSAPLGHWLVFGDRKWVQTSLDCCLLILNPITRLICDATGQQHPKLRQAAFNDAPHSSRYSRGIASVWELITKYRFILCLFLFAMPCHHSQCLREACLWPSRLCGRLADQVRARNDRVEILWSALGELSQPLQRKASTLR